MRQSEDDAVHKMPHKMKMCKLAESDENFGIGLILNPRPIELDIKDVILVQYPFTKS